MFSITFEGIGVDIMSNHNSKGYPAEFKESAIKRALDQLILQPKQQET